MNRVFKILIVFVCLFAASVGYAQGTVAFANIGGGVNAPIGGPDGLLGTGYLVQLQLLDGTNVGEPAPILTNGLFSGGTRTIDGFPGGSNLSLKIAVLNSLGAVVGTSGSFRVTLATSDETPAVLTLRAFDINEAGCPIAAPDLYISFPKPDSGEIWLSWEAHLPFRAIANAAGVVVCHDLWMSTSAAGESGKKVDWDKIEFFGTFWRAYIDPTDEAMFFWLAPRE